MTIDQQLLEALRKFAKSNGSTLDESPTSTLTIPVTGPLGREQISVFMLDEKTVPSYMRDDEGLPHLATCEVFDGKVCTCRTGAEKLAVARLQITR